MSEILIDAAAEIVCGRPVTDYERASIVRFPVCITSESVGVYPESDYDEFGEIAPVTWFCVCGRKLKSANWQFMASMTWTDSWGDENLDGDYVPVSPERKAEFMATHTACEGAVLELAAELDLTPSEVCSELRSWTLTEQRRYYGTGEFAPVQPNGKRAVDKTEYLTHEENVTAFGETIRRSTADW